MLDKSFSFILAYPSTVVSHIFEKLGVPTKGLVLDPFCGTGTTLIECKRRGLSSVGIDANPVCAIAAAVKTRWNINAPKILMELEEVLADAKKIYNRIAKRYKHASRFFGAPEVQRLSGFNSVMNSGVVGRGWIGHRPALMALILAHRVRLVKDRRLRELLLLPLLGALVAEFSNLKYGPELYWFKRRRDVDVFGVYRDKVRSLLQSIKEHRAQYGDVSARIICGSSTQASVLRTLKDQVEFVVTSPPYPAEHDYARMLRLELAFGGFLEDTGKLRKIKRAMIPSSSKSSYVDQKYYDCVKGFSFIRNIRGKVLAKSKTKLHGFAKVYPRLVGDYFGAMYMHFKELNEILPRGARCAYVVGDQSSFFGVRIHTARLLEKLLSSGDLSFKVIGIETWRTRRATTGTGRKRLPERILYFEKV